MAQYVVPPRKKRNVIIKCKECGTLYVPDKGNHPYGDPSNFERCPTCNYGANKKEQIIPLWRYNLIRYWRGLFNHEQTDISSTDD